MSKQLNITTTYDETTRILTTTTTLNGFVAELPAEVITAQQVDMITLFDGPIISSSDISALNMSFSRSAMFATAQLAAWEQARLNKAKADLLPAPPPP